MPTTKLGVFASLALAASAILLPPTITADDLGDDNALETLAINPFKRSVALECPGCPLAVHQDKAITWKEGTGNAFLLDFEIGSHEDTLDIAGFQLHPPVFNPETVSYYVTQIDPNSESNLRLRVTGSIFRYNGAETVSEDGTELLPFSLQITGLEGMPVNPPELKINVLKDSEGRLMIASFDTVQTSEAIARVGEKECNEWPLLCKWKGIVAERIEKMKKMGKGCHKRPHGRPNTMAMDDLEGKPPHRVRPGHFGRPHHGPHYKSHGGHGHARHHRLHMFFRRALFTVLIPIVIGIFAGTVTYLIGMAVGCFVAMSIAKFRGQRYQRIALEEDVEQAGIVSESKKEDYAELPAYDAPPVYEAAEEKAVDESE